MPQYSAEEVLGSLKKMHAACWATGTPSVALSVPESTVTGTSQFPEAQRKWHTVNHAIAGWAKAKQAERSLQSPLFVNSASLLSFNNAPRMRGLWDPDSLHFSAAGSREFGSKLAPVVASHLQGQMYLPESSAPSQQPSTPERMNVR